jgi:prepilin-type N-terminal cleavage/methylation domain-containing protein
MRKPRNNMVEGQDRQGFTLTELMVVVAVIGILSGMVIVASGNEWRRQRVNTVAQSLASWLSQVRSASQRRTGSGCLVQFAATGNYSTGATIAEIVPGSACIGTIPEAQVKITGFGATDTFAFNRSTAQLQFTPKGMSTNTADVILGITLQGSAPQRCVRISPLVAMIRMGRNNTSTLPTGTCTYSDVSPF